jgi:valyl-tRNA synthetase
MATNFSSQAIPNRFDYTEAQDRIYQFWESAGNFHAEPDTARPPFSIVIPPPNVTGALHLGHALNNTLQDVLIRMKRMQGFNTLWMPGTDHAGIATQAVVERRLLEEEGKTRHDLGREKLVERIWQWKEDYEARILTQLKRMGCSCDWRRTRFTLDDVCARAVRHTFFDLFRKNLIYRGKRLVNWDTYLQTAVSDDEVFHDPVQGHFWHIRYPVIDPQPGEPTHVSVATTRPETMLGDTAVAVHPDPAQALDRVEEELQAKRDAAPAKEKPPLEEQLQQVRQRRQEMLPALKQLREMARDGRQVLLPLLDRPIPLIADAWAKPEMGSGCVKITPAHDPNDYEVGLRQDLPMINILNPDGTLNENAGPYQAQTILAARQRVVEDLQERDLLEKVEDREIDLAHSDRSKTPIEPYLADQWFVKMDAMAQSAMDAVTDGRVKILPERYTKGYLDWLSEKRDWPIGRQLWWGHRIPVWTLTLAQSAGADAVRASLQEAFAAQGVDEFSACVAEAQDSPAGTLRFCTLDEQADEVFEQIEQALAGGGSSRSHPQAAAVAALTEQVEREDEVLDTWFSSALWPHSTLGWPERTPELECYYPTSVLITSRDIITLWVARMVLTGLNNMGDIPFHEVFIHPKILDGYGVTMSKSKGNGVDPLDVIDKFGPDALRFGLAYLATDTQDVRLPVQFECPHCEHLLDQTTENREQARIECSKCGKPFATQWARSEEDLRLPRGPVVSERFEQARNFCNKLWNAARFALINLNHYVPGPVVESELTVEDRWLLSRLATVTKEVTEALEGYHYADASRALYEFAWDEFCSFYVEMVKGRLQEETSRATAQRVLAHTLDALLRLLHPTVPYITEEIWQLLNQAAPIRGVPHPHEAAGSVMVAAWPQVDTAHQDPDIEAQFATFQKVLGAVREIRSRQTIPAKTSVEFFVRADEATCARLAPMQPYFKAMANAHAAAWGPQVEVPATRAAVSLPGMDVFVDLTGLIDVEAEIDRNQQQERKLLGLIQGKEKKLANDNFVQRAPAEIVSRERGSLAQLQEQLAAVQATLGELRGRGV